VPEIMHGRASEVCHHMTSIVFIATFKTQPKKEENNWQVLDIEGSTGTEL
jgi:hypothetical protein